MIEIKSSKAFIKAIETNHKDILQKSEKSIRQFLSRKDIGFSWLPQRAHLWNQSMEIGQKLAQKYQHMVLVGIGGSSLGVRVVADVFNKKNISFIDNVDAVEFQNITASLNLENTCWVFASKSGTTIETLCSLEFIEQMYREKSISFFERCAVITENKESSLFNWAQKNHIPVAEIPLDVGGRFSVLSPVGMLPAAFLKLDVEEFREGAAGALKDINAVAQMMAESVLSFERQEWITLLWPYCSLLKSFGLWYQQLWAESLGKKVNRQNIMAPRASTPVFAVGATDQHSILQQVMEGVHDKMVIFMRILESEKGSKSLQVPQFPETQSLKNKKMGELLAVEAIATSEAMDQVGVSNLTIQTKVLDERTLGYLLMHFQLVVAGIGEYLDINAFDQPGVELGKKLAKQKLSER